MAGQGGGGVKIKEFRIAIQNTRNIEMYKRGTKG